MAQCWLFIVLFTEVFTESVFNKIELKKKIKPLVRISEKIQK